MEKQVKLKAEEYKKALKVYVFNQLQFLGSWIS
jgi:hypothetical protein